MSTGGPSLTSAKRLLELRIVHVVLVLLCVIFAVLCLFERRPGQIPEGALEHPVLSYISIPVAAFGGLVSLVVPSFLLKYWCRRLARGDRLFLDPSQVDTGRNISEDRYWRLLQSHFTFGAAILEGTIFYHLLAYLQEGRLWTLGLAILFWLMLLLKFPTDLDTRRWIEMQRDQVALMRNSGM